MSAHSFSRTARRPNRSWFSSVSFLSRVSPLSRSTILALRDTTQVVGSQ